MFTCTYIQLENIHTYTHRNNKGRFFWGEGRILFVFPYITIIYFTIRSLRLTSLSLYIPPLSLPFISPSLPSSLLINLTEIFKHIKSRDRSIMNLDSFFKYLFFGTFTIGLSLQKKKKLPGRFRKTPLCVKLRINIVYKIIFR